MAESNVQVTEGVGKKLHTNQRTIGANTVEDEYVLMGLPFFPSYIAQAGSISTATALSHLMQLMAGASLNVYVTRIRIYQQAVATTGAFGRIFIYRLTTAGTGGGAITPLALDTTDSASGASAQTLPTAKGTEAANAIIAGVGRFIQTIGTGGAATDPLLFEWDADRAKSKAIRIPAGTANGIAVKCIDAIAAAQVVIDIDFFEANY